MPYTYYRGEDRGGWMSVMEGEVTAGGGKANCFDEAPDTLPRPLLAYSKRSTSSVLSTAGVWNNLLLAD